MTEENERERERIKKAFEKTVNRHGYGFHYRVIKQAYELSRNIPVSSPWRFEASEVPVEVQGQGTRIDFVLSHRDYNTPFYMLAECKRANPALSNWCFARSPFTRRGLRPSRIILERAMVDSGRNVYTLTQSQDVGKSVYHIALEVKSNTSGDPQSSGRGAIEDAATQVLRGLNGMVNFLSHNEQLFHEYKSIDLFPVIFTTAQIWVSQADLSNADLMTGNLDLSQIGLDKADWILYEYNTSPGLKHPYSYNEKAKSLAEVLHHEYVRTIAVVGPTGIGSFLAWSGGIWMGDAG